jgi:GT2 family glycosyltransferase
MQASRELPAHAVPDVSVVRPTCGRVDLLDRCLDAILRQTLDGRRFEVIVVDDNPRHDARHNTRQLVAVWRASAGERGPVLRYLPGKVTRGPAAIRNLGWRNARAPVVAFTEDDTVPSPNWLRQGLDAFGHNVDAAAGSIDHPPGSTPANARRRSTGFSSANCFCRKAILDKLGGFDHRFHSAWCEDFHFRMIKAHASIVRAEHALVVCPARRTAWGASVWQLKNLVFDALLYKTHPQLYRQKIQASPAWDDCAIVAAFAVLLTGLSAANSILALSGAVAWGVPTALHCRNRLRGPSRSPAHVAEIILTSVLIPPIAVFWRLAGAIRFRVRFA